MPVIDGFPEDFLEFFPEASSKTSSMYTSECICMYANVNRRELEGGDVLSWSDYDELGWEIAGKVPGIINSVLPLAESWGWDNAHTQMSLVPDPSKCGMLYFEKGMNDKSGTKNDCYYIRFWGIKSAYLSADLVKVVYDALIERWPNTKIMKDNERDSATMARERREAEAKEKQAEEWHSQGLCQYCGGQLGMFKKCKSCGRKQ